jgi:hypothetical protein
MVCLAFAQGPEGGLPRFEIELRMASTVLFSMVKTKVTYG